jgi:superfamily II DNA/RNA helicase
VGLTGTFLRPDRVQVLVQREQLPLKGIRTLAVTGLSDEDKVATLVDVLPKLAHRNVLVFTNTPEAASGLADRLRRGGLTCDEVHPRLDWREQADAMARFRAGKSNLLVASGAFGRGLDIQNLGLVVNFELPRGGNAFEEYLHRVGRVGRCGRKGVALNLVATNEERTKQGIENHYSVAWEDLMDLAQLQG